MPTLAAIRENLAGAWLVMRGRPEGLDRLDLSITGFWRSFGAIVAVLPLALLSLESQRRVEAALTGASAAPGAGIGLQALAVAVDWVVFPIVFALMARPLGFAPRYVPFIVARNWAAVIVSACVGALHACFLVGIVPAEVLSFVLLVGIAFVLGFSFMVARTALAASAGMAVPIVVLDFVISLVLMQIFYDLG
jgi:hypothetical protein